ncbi:MAG: aerobic carbon-monoxide dehydrogenase large subunit [Actinomycetota bacterium]|nr:aerobic carbon-monoxide dehydrogenase large subunit [Actinomycetota bacterium]
MTTRWLGERVQRREDPKLLTGQGRFLDDLGRGAAAAAFVRSTMAHARISAIDTTEAAAVPGVLGVYTWDDLTGKAAGPLPLLIPHPELVHPRTQRALAHGEVNHVGEAIAMVVATDRYVAEDAAELVIVDYEPLPAVVGLDASRAAEHLVHDDVPGNVAAHFVQTVGDVDGALANAPHRLTIELDIERSLSSPLEGRGVLARWDDDDERLRIHTSTQSSTGVRAAVAELLGLPDGQVEVICPDIGGGFGTKVMHPYPEEVLVPWAARRLDRSVKWVEDRVEHFTSATHERGQKHTVNVGFDDDGRILAMDVDFLHDSGAYVPYGIVLPIITSTQLPGPYKLGTYRVGFRSMYTNTVTCTPYRGAGRPQGCFAMERTVDRIAEHLGKDRCDVRAANLIQVDEFPYDLHLTFQDGRPAIYDSGNYPEMLGRIKEMIGWDEFPRLQAEAAAGGRRLGIGIGCYVEGTGVGPYEGAHIRVETSGRVMVATGLTSQGQGHQTVLAQIVADELGVDIADVYVTTGDTRRMPYAVGTYASRTAVMSGNAVALAARAVREKAVRVAAEGLEANPDDLEIVDGMVRVKGTPAAAIPLRQVAVLSNPLRYAFSEEAQAATQFAKAASDDRPPVADDDEPGLEGTDYYSPVRSTFASGMHAVIVETDPDTADINIVRYCVIHDCGTLINPMLVDGQIHGGVAQGVAGALLERVVYDEDGNLTNASFMDFLMPYATEVPTIETGHMETPSPLNPLGIKGAGEAGVIPSSAAIAAAIEDAEGIPINAMPISPSDLWTLRAANPPAEAAEPAAPAGSAS